MFSMFSIFKKRDPVCGMKEEKGEGITKDGNWFCSAKCVQEFEKGSTSQRNKHHGCCH